MENIYFFELPLKNQVDEAIKSQDFKNLRVKVIDCVELSSHRTGYFLYLRGRSEFLDRAESMLKLMGIKKLIGEESMMVAREFHSRH